MVLDRENCNEDTDPPRAQTHNSKLSTRIHKEKIVNKTCGEMLTLGLANHSNVDNLVSVFLLTSMFRIRMDDQNCPGQVSRLLPFFRYVCPVLFCPSVYILVRSFLSSLLESHLNR